jgi:hypothetical protein
MDDDKPTGVAPQATSGEIETPSSVTPDNQTTPQDRAEGPVTEKQVSYNALREERTKRQELQRELAQLKSRGQPQYQPEGDDDFNRVMSHPFVQNLMLSQAKRELIDYARDTMDQFPSIPDSVKKAILKNPRGFVQEETVDIENAKLDLLEYIEGLAEMSPDQQRAVAKSFPVTATNATGAESAGSPAEIQKILNKPIDEWTKDEEALVDQYQKNAPKK